MVGQCWCRLLDSLSLVALGLSVGYETWPPIGWHHAFVIGWSKYRLGLLSSELHYGLTWPVGIPTVFHTPVTVPLHSPNGRQCLLLVLCKGTVEESSADGVWTDGCKNGGCWYTSAKQAPGHQQQPCWYQWLSAKLAVNKSNPSYSIMAGHFCMDW